MAQAVAGGADGSRPEAWFCADDVLAIGAMAALRAAGLSVPGDVGVLGLNDIAMAGWAGIDLTTIRQPFEAIVRSTIELMADILAEPGRLPEARLLPCRLVERATLRPLPEGAANP
jgi:DNA-binding LacI/PurR family transcriptional regulator